MYYCSVFTELQPEEWSALLKKQERVFSFHSAAFIDSCTQVSGLQSKYFGVKKADKSILGLQVFVKGKSIVQPLYFGYSALLIDPELSEGSRLEAMECLLQGLKHRHKSIDLRIEPRKQDIRPFLWEGFAAQQRFTYIKSTKDPVYNRNVVKNIRAAGEMGIHYAINTDVEHSLNSAITEMREMGGNNPDLLAALCKDWYKKGVLSTIDALDASGKVMASQILLEQEPHFVYLLLLTKIDKGGNTKVHSGLYDFIIRHYGEKGIAYVDFGGANYSSIARFKSNFFPDLESYTVLSYRSGWKGKVRTVIQKILQRL